MAERLRAALAGPVLQVPDGAAIALSASIGVAQWQEGAESAEQLVARADAALFEAKSAGRNLVAGRAAAQRGAPS